MKNFFNRNKTFYSHHPGPGGWRRDIFSFFCRSYCFFSKLWYNINKTFYVQWEISGSGSVSACGKGGNGDRCRRWSKRFPAPEPGGTDRAPPVPSGRGGFKPPKANRLPGKLMYQTSVYHNKREVKHVLPDRRVKRTRTSGIFYFD